MVSNDDGALAPQIPTAERNLNAAFSIVNAMGAIVNRQGKVVRGYFGPTSGARFQPTEALERQLTTIEQSGALPGNTTLTVVVTNQKLDRRTLQQFARQVHTSMARAIQPFQTVFDGDILYAVTTNEVDNPALDAVGLGVLASEATWDAILTIVDGA
jgi:L-aminopeptidase/D-esterase-like protein